MTATLAFAEFAPDHLEGALALSRQYAWPHRREDWDLALRLSRGAVALDGDRVVGTALATSFGPVATANMIIVDGGHGGRGLGRALMDRAMAMAEPAEWRLIATEAGRPLYERLGFAAQGRIVQRQGHMVAVARPDGVDWAAPADAPALEALDRQATGADRSGLIAALFALGRIAVLRDADGLPRAWAARRDFGRGEVVGPVVAADAVEARALFSFLFADRTGAFLRVDADEATGLGPWLAAHGLANAGGGLRMSRGAAPAAPGPVRTFALANQALG